MPVMDESMFEDAESMFDDKDPKLEGATNNLLENLYRLYPKENKNMVQKGLQNAVKIIAEDKVVEDKERKAILF